MTMQADRDRMLRDFLELTQLDSVSFRERKLADRLKDKLLKLGFEVHEDTAGNHYDSETGNIYGRLPADGTGGRPVLFSAHMDTVEPGLGKQPEYDREKGVIRSRTNTVLGADDVCGITEILEGIRIAAVEKESHGEIEVLFTIAEEQYGKGAKVFDMSRIQSSDVYVLDMSGTPGKAANKAPSIISFTADIYGKAAHAGFNPQNGIHAVGVAASAVARIPLGKITENTTLNIGTIQGGTEDNIVPEHCRVTGECRSFCHEEALQEVDNVQRIFGEAATAAGAQIRFQKTVQIKAYETPADAAVCRDFTAACARLGLAGELVSTHGGSDNNIFSERDLQGIVLSCGMFSTHSIEEYARLDDMVSGAQLVAEIIRERRYGS